MKALTTWINKGLTEAPCEKSGLEVPILKIFDVVFNAEQISKRMNETENKRDTYNVEKMYQINQQQAESIHSNQSLEINQNGNNKEKKKPFWKKAWIVISAIIAALAGLAAVFGKNLSDFFGL